MISANYFNISGGLSLAELTVDQTNYALYATTSGTDPRVGIGTSEPSVELEVSGTISANNDPVIVKISNHKFWISIADSDVLLWLDGIVSALNLDVKVTEPDISPLAIQGPKSFDLMEKIYGKEIKE